MNVTCLELDLLITFFPLLLLSQISWEGSQTDNILVIALKVNILILVTPYSQCNIFCILWLCYSLAVLDMLTSITSVIVSNCSVQNILMSDQRLCGLSLMLHGLPNYLAAFILMLISVDRLRAVCRVSEVRQTVQ